MSKLSELAELLNSAKKPIVEQAIEPEPIPEPPKPTVIQKPPESESAINHLQRDFQLLKKMFEESTRRPIYQPSYSGGGADSTADIHRPVRTITANYSLTTRDWYVGVGTRNQIITVTLPTSIKNGREYVIKDEAGIAELVPIRVVGLIDNDPEGLELRINNGSLTLLYNNGWRLI